MSSRRTRERAAFDQIVERIRAHDGDVEGRALVDACRQVAGRAEGHDKLVPARLLELRRDVLQHRPQSVGSQELDLDSLRLCQHESQSRNGGHDPDHGVLPYVFSIEVRILDDELRQREPWKWRADLLLCSSYLDIANAAGVIARR